MQDASDIERTHIKIQSQIHWETMEWIGGCYWKNVRQGTGFIWLRKGPRPAPFNMLMNL